MEGFTLDLLLLLGLLTINQLERTVIANARSGICFGDIEDTTTVLYALKPKQMPGEYG